jgi:hypothetical protein
MFVLGSYVSGSRPCSSIILTVLTGIDGGDCSIGRNRDLHDWRVPSSSKPRARRLGVGSAYSLSVAHGAHGLPQCGP